MQLVGRRVRNKAQLIDGRTDRNVWVEGFTRPYRNVLRLRGSILSIMKAVRSLNLSGI